MEMTNRPSTIVPLKRSLLLWPFLALVLCLCSCDKEEEPIPAYLEIKPFELLPTAPEVHGSISQKITNARVIFIDQNDSDSTVHSIGTVTLPVTIPVLATGAQKIVIDPVIKGGGNSFSLQLYPFYERFEQVLNMPPNSDVTVQPTTTYKPEAKFEFIEDFEGATHRFQDDQDNNPGTFIEISDEDVFEGNASGKIHLDTGNVVIVVATEELFQFVFEDAQKVFMEVNYKTDVPLEFGVQAINSLGQANTFFEFGVLAKDEWNKIYFDFTSIMSTQTEPNFAFVLRAGIPIQDGVFTLEEADIYLDNIKLIHF